MTSGMLQDSFQTSQSTGPRFRPYASPNHRVTKGRYITSNDPRGYIPVYEYPLNGLWIMMDSDDGYVLWTGIWKALGNSKADIVKMIDSQPDLAPLIRRVRGGYLKIQGTWMPYEVALRLSRRVAWPIRNDLIPLFGPTFPSTCLSPDQPGYGQVVASANGRRRMRRANQTAGPTMSHPRESHTNWTIVTPNRVDPSAGPTSPRLPFSAARYPSDNRFLPHQNYQNAIHMGPPMDVGSTSRSANPDVSVVRDRATRMRYSPYPGSLHSKRASPSRTSLSLDIPSLALHEPSSPSTHSPHGAADPEHIRLPPIQPPSHMRAASHSRYALPPISALEDLRGIHSQDSAAVLRRLKANDDFVFDTGRLTGEQVWTRGRSLSAPPYKRPSDGGPMSPRSPKFATYPHSRTLQARKEHRVTGPSFEGRSGPYDSRIGVTAGFTSEPSGDESSTCDPSPVSPVTPGSASTNDNHFGLVPMASRKDHGHAPLSYAFTSHDWPKERGADHMHSDMLQGADTRLPMCRSSYREDSDNDSTHPMRPW